MFPRRPRCAPRPARMLPRRSRLHKRDLRMFPRRPCTATSTARMFPRPRHGNPFPRRARQRRGNIYRMFPRRPCHATIGAGETFSGRMADGETFRAAGTGKHFRALSWMFPRRAHTHTNVVPLTWPTQKCCPVDAATKCFPVGPGADGETFCVLCNVSEHGDRRNGETFLCHLSNGETLFCGMEMFPRRPCWCQFADPASEQGRPG